MKLFEKTVYLICLFLFVITAYLTYANYELKQEVIYIEKNVVPEVIQVSVPCEVSDYNFKCEYNTTINLYHTNVFPSKQCHGKKLSDLHLLDMMWRTGSMRPYMFAGDKVLVTLYDPKIDLVLGDVVSNGKYLHRIVAINDESKRYQTKGDNNQNKDSEWTDFDKTEWIVCGVLRGTE